MTFRRDKLKRMIRKGLLLGRVSSSYTDDSRFDVHHDNKRQFMPVELYPDFQEMNKSSWDGKAHKLTEWHLKTKSGGAWKDEKTGIINLSVHSNEHHEFIEKKLLAKLKAQGLN